MAFHPDLRVSISGIRGFSPSVLDSKTAYALVRGFCALVPPGPIVLSRDPRPSGKELKEAVLTALSDEGREVLDCDLIPLPTTQVFIRAAKAAGGIDITASHNPPEYNGLKFLDATGSFISQEMLDALLLGGENYKESFSTVKIPQSIRSSTEEAMDAHLTLLKSAMVPGKRLTVAVDACNGAGSYLVPLLLTEMGCDVVPIAVSPEEGFPRMPEPMPDNLVWTQEKLRGLTYDICVVVDPDSDRLTLIDEQGTLLSEEITLPLIALGYVGRGEEGVMVVNESTSQMIEAVTEGTGITVVRSAVGEFNVVKTMKTHGAIFGGEGNGSVIDPRINYGRDALAGIVHVINGMRMKNMSLSALVAEIPAFAMIKDKIPAGTLTHYDDFYTRVQALFPEGEYSRQDGLRITMPGKTWLHVRPSNTEPIFRIIGEAPTYEEIHAIMSCIKELLS